MSILLRHPAMVPALFSRALDADLPTRRRETGWRNHKLGFPLGALSVWAVVVLVEVPLARTAAAIVGLRLYH